jgi:hypothetical protein
MAKLETFLDVEAALSRLLEGAAVKASKITIGKIMARMKEGDTEGAYEAALSFDAARYLTDMEKKLRLLLTTAVVLGASRHGPLKSSKLVESGGIPDLIEAGMVQLVARLDELGERMGRIGVDTINLELARQKESETALKTESGVVQDFRKALGAAVGAEAVRSVQTTAGLHASRLASYGFLKEADLMQRRVYRITEQLDNRICSVCAIMHGKTFTVAPALNRLETILLERDITAIKALAPFPKQTAASIKELESMSRDELRRNGLDTPPYHPLCRGQLVVSDISEETLLNPPSTFPDALQTSVLTPVAPQPLVTLVNGSVIRGSDLKLTGANVIKPAEVSAALANSMVKELLYTKATPAVAAMATEAVERLKDKIGPLGVAGPTLYTKSSAVVSSSITGAGLTSDDKVLEAVVQSAALATLTSAELNDLKAEVAGELGADATPAQIAKAVRKRLLSLGYDTLIVANPLYGDTVVVLDPSLLKFVSN